MAPSIVCAEVTKLICNPTPDATGYKFYIRFNDAKPYTQRNARPIQPNCELILSEYIKADGIQKAVVAPITDLGELENSNEIIIIKEGLTFTTKYPTTLKVE